jgi:acyl carrier protein
VISQAEVTGQLRQILAALTGDARALSLPPETPLLRDGVGLDSLGGTLLLTRVHGQFGVDVAGEDLNLDSLATLGALAAFITERAART